jgi:predicted polyphosphate/ATP-dependent NAD kinase
MTISIGLIVNPVAGIAGTVGLKGSDDPLVQQQAIALGAISMSQARLATALQVLLENTNKVPDIQWLTGSDGLGQQVLESLGLSCKVVYHLDGESTGRDTRMLAAKLALQVDLLVFVGGDGTARDVADGLQDSRATIEGSTVVIGIPSGCKIQSGVFGHTPHDVGHLLARFCNGAPATIVDGELRDLDEEMLNQGKVVPRHYGYLKTLDCDDFVQKVKCAALVTDEEYQADIAADFIELMEDNVCYFVGPGTTMAEIKRQISDHFSLLGVDVILNGQMVDIDANEQKLLDWQKKYPSRLALSITGQQGFLFGRGNRVLTKDVIRHSQLQHIYIAVTPEKIRKLEGQPIRVDTGDPLLDQQLKGSYSIHCGYQTEVLYQVR